MYTKTNLSNLSYINKDFNSIYSEILSLCEELSPRWSPSSSTESDPGIVLLKLDAIMADKCNYNIDKNILELFPSSVTQYPNAREIFDQCGYVMKHYQAAEVYVSLNIKSESTIETSAEELFNADYSSDKRIYTIPRFTAISNNDDTVKYVLVEPDIILRGNGTSIRRAALEGSINDYMINNDKYIKYNYLDTNNRLYFSETNVAENGIFIFDIHNGEVDYESESPWIKVDNLTIQPLLSKCYKFGVTRDGSMCYLEFPSDIAHIIGDGIAIKYITTSGYSGNIGPKELSKPLLDVSAKLSAENYFGDSFTVNLTTSNIDIDNPNKSNYGADPETIEEARKNYEKVKNTFNTLVSNQDYNNFLKTSKKCSVGFFTDRSNDILGDTVNIISKDRGFIETKHTIKQTASSPNMTAFDLKLYAYNYSDSIDSQRTFEETFNPVGTSGFYKIVNDLEDIKCISHDIKNPYASSSTTSVVGILLEYRLDILIIPQYRLDNNQKESVTGNIVRSLQNLLLPQNLGLGNRVLYDVVYDSIMQSDYRIKSLMLRDITYTPIIIINNSGNLRYVKVKKTSDGYSYTHVYADNNLNNKPVTDADIKACIDEIYTKCQLAGVTQVFDFDTSFESTLNQMQLDEISTDKISTNTELTINVSNDTGSITLLENEQLYLATPNYTEVESFTNYCKFIYNGSNISPNVLSKLESDDSIIFLWSDDSAGQSYNYKRFGAGTILNSSIQLLSDSMETGVTDLNQSAAYTIISKACRSNYGVLSSSSSDPDIISAFETAKKLRGNFILNPPKTISIRDTYSKTIGPTNPSEVIGEYVQAHKAFWILNSKDGNNESALFDNLPATFEESRTFERILDSGEYFFYATSDNELFVQLGAGYKIQVKVEYESELLELKKMKVKAKNYAEAMLTSTSLLDSDDLWYKIPLDMNFIATEMQYYVLGKDCTVTFTRKEPSGSASTIKIDNTEISFSDTDNLENYNISYRYNGSNDIELPSFNFSNDSETWSGHSILNLNCGPANPQKIVNNATHKQSIAGANGMILPAPSDPSHPIDPNNPPEIFYIKTNYDISLQGGKDINTTVNKLFDESNGTESLKFLAYITDSSIGEFSKNADGGYMLTAEKDDSSKFEYTIKLAKPDNSSNKVLIPIYINQEIGTIEFTGDPSITVTPLYTTKTEAGMHYFTATISADTNITISITLSSSDEASLSIIIYPPLLINNNPEDDIDALKSLDNQFLFDYSYIIPQDKLIDDPLSAEAFLNENHPYNKYILCKWKYSTTSNDISITDNIR